MARLSARRLGPQPLTVAAVRRDCRISVALTATLSGGLRRIDPDGSLLWDLRRFAAPLLRRLPHSPIGFVRCFGCRQNRPRGRPGTRGAAKRRRWGYAPHHLTPARAGWLPVGRPRWRLPPPFAGATGLRLVPSLICVEWFKFIFFK